MIKVNAMGDTCPIPVVKTKKAIDELQGPGVVETLVDNDIAVQNLTKMANQLGYKVESKKLSESSFSVVMTIEDAPCADGEESCMSEPSAETARKNIVVAIASSNMGEGDDTLGAALMKGFIYALSQQEELPATMLFYNGGARITCEGSASLEDLHAMEEQGVEILTCGTCLNHYGLAQDLRVGEVTNMYVIAEKLTRASLIVKP